jgi:4-amino-4-deoxy-L-arabinose transferase-like glycosyltransferase
MIKKNYIMNYQRAFWALLIAVTVFRLFYIQWIQLAPDEAYYFTWSQNLQWGYYDHPPMVGFLIWVFTSLAGQGEFGVRLGWVLIGALLGLLLFQIGREMFGSDRAGFFSVLLMNIALVASTGAVIATPDAPQALFWVLGIFSVFRAVEEKSRVWWMVTGVALGLGLLSKYTMILFAPCIFFFLLSTAEGRRWLRRKEPYLAFLLGLLIFAPVIWWNGQNDWVSFRFQLSHGLHVKKSVGLRYFGEFWAGQAGVVSPLLFLGVVWAMFRSAVDGFRQRKNHLLLLFWTSAPILMFFAYTSIRAKVEANWPVLAYFSAIVALAGIAGGQWDRWRRGRRSLAWVTMASALLITVLAHVQPLYAVVPIPPRKDPTSQLHGWRSLGKAIEVAARSLDPNKEVFLLTPRHQLVGEGMFYTGRKFPIYQWDAPQRINHLAVTNSPPAGSQAIFFTEGGDGIPKDLEPLFDSCEKVEVLQVRRNASIVRTHPIWKCVGFKGLQSHRP